MENMLLYAHSGIRWLVVLITFVALGVLILRSARRKPYDDANYRVMLIWSSLIGVQWLLGILLFFVLDAFDVGYQWEHAVTMTLVLAVAHVHIMVKRRPDNVRYNAALISIGAALLLVFVGVARLPQGWGFEVNVREDTGESSWIIPFSDGAIALQLIGED